MKLRLWTFILALLALAGTGYFVYRQLSPSADVALLPTVACKVTNAINNAVPKDKIVLEIQNGTLEYEWGPGFYKETTQQESTDPITGEPYLNFYQIHRTWTPFIALQDGNVFKVKNTSIQRRLQGNEELENQTNERETIEQCRG